ncbi:MAG TPA: hypothetical protein VFG69_14280, partial [Nannocystaceae bacterium]|nr:hypothetical protein [Nannocystaceae bacterium]
EDDGDGDDDAATKGAMTFDDDGGGATSTSGGGVGKTSGPTDAGEESSDADEGEAPLESSGGALESSDGEVPADDDDDDGPSTPTGDPMYSPCSADSDCAGDVCLLIVDQFDNVLSAFCSGPCAFPQQDCDPPPDGDASPACFIAEQGVSICTLDCEAASCPAGMQCLELGAGAFRCV